MKQRILQVITSMLLIMTLTMANFLLLCVDVVSYAADVINVDKNTNHKNIEFMAYFKDENENKIVEKDTYTNSENLKLYFKISVKQEGYFNGNIVLNNANFRLKTDILSSVINRIENNTIYLNQINAGEDEEIEVGIEILKDEQFDLNFINMESEISIDGIYIDSTQKDISIYAKRNVTLNLVNSYETADGSIILSQEVITNKILNFNGEDKRIIQVEVTSGLNNNLFPVETTTINIQAPKISDTYPENVLVNSNDILATNGKMLSKDNWNYNNETGQIDINIENAEEDSKVSWIKSGEDKIIITYVFGKDTKINNEILSVNSKIKFYDINNTIIEGSNEISLSKEEIDSIVTADINQNETSIYKGKLYAGISRDITYKNVINVNLNNIANEINIEEDNPSIGETKLELDYKTSKISKADIENILGENGSLNIIDSKTGNIIATINKDTEGNENGDIIISYPENIETINFRLISPEKIGKLEIENTRTINSISKNIVKNASDINLKYSASYVSNNSKNQVEAVESNIELKETESSVDLQINRTELSAMTSNNNVEFRIVLNSKGEKDELFKNPVLRLELPEKIQNVEINSINLLYEDELKIKSATLKDNIIEVALSGEQTKYKEEAIDGATIIINTNLTTSQKIASTTEQVKLTYTNENVINYRDNTEVGTVVNDINIVSYAGVVTTNQILEYGIDIVNNEGVESGNLDVSADTKDITIDKKIINNKENKISDVKILGVFPTKEAIDTNNIDIEVGTLSIDGIDSSRVKVYYSDNEKATENLEDVENGWSESIKDNKNVKKYLVVINELDLLEEINLSYQISIPANLEYNESAEEGYTVYYKNLTTEEQVNTKFIRLGTPKGAVVETTLKTLIAGKESSEVKENGILRYVVDVSNTGSEEISSIKVSAKVPDGTVFINTEALNKQTELDGLVIEDESKTEVEFNIEKLAPGESMTKYYEVKVKDGMAGKKIANSVTTQYGEITKTSNEVINTVEEGNLGLAIISIDAIEGVLKSGYQYRYVLNVTNTSDEDIKNVTATINVNDALNILEIYYINSESNIVTQKDANSIEIDEISAGETVEVSIYTTAAIFKDGAEKEATISATCIENKNEYNSNEVNNIVKSNLALTMTVTSESSQNYVKAGDTIKYNVIVKNEGKETTNLITVSNWLSNDVTLTKVTRNGTELSSEEYSLKIDSNKNQKLLKFEENSIDAGETIEYQIEVVANLLYGSTNATEIISEYLLKVDSFEIATAKVEHILQPNQIESGEENNGEDNNDNGSTPEDTNRYKIISGVAWIDENENGQKDAEENAFEGLTVKLLNVETNEFVKDTNGDVLTTTTSSTGFYSFSKVEKGQYLVIFEYDTTQYGLTTFEKSGVSAEMNSNVITKNINIDGTDTKVAATEIIDVNDSNIANINIGLIVAKKYDLQLDKFISKVTVQNDKTVTEEYEDATLVKQEIDAKQVNSTMVVVEYTIRVTNKGDVTAYVKKIADYLSVDYKFNSELNKDWYQSGNDVYCTSLANEKIEPGESREVKLTVIKEIKENNTGLVNNTAEIVSSYNEFGLTDINSTEGNKVKGENDMGSADLIISIKTGQVVMTVSLIIFTIVILAVAIFLIRRMIINGKMI